MGFIKVGLDSIKSTFADQYKEYFYCEAMDKDLLVTKGQKRVSGRSSNKGNDNIITSGSVVAVADGQCMMVVEQGKIVAVCAEPGEFIYDTSSEPSIFSGKLGSSIEQTFKTIGRRIAFGGDTAKDQRVYYFNLKELMDNKFGTPSPIDFRVVDSKIQFDMDVSVRCSGVYSYRISDPLLFYTNVCGNIQKDYMREEIDAQLKAEFISALRPALGRLSALEIRPNQLAAHNADLEVAMRDTLSDKWEQTRGLKIVSIALHNVTLPPEDAEMLKQAQKEAQKLLFMSDPTRIAANLATAQADAMRAAASNSAGAMTGFMGLNMAMNNGGGMDYQNLFAMGQQQRQQQQQQQQNGWKCSCGATVTGKFCPECGSKKPEPVKMNGWKCSCGATATGKFCPECGSKKPEENAGWTCSCGQVNKGKFCPNCGSRKPAAAPLYRCDKCGWEPADPKNPPKFCPECGDLFDESDVKR